MYLVFVLDFGKHLCLYILITEWYVSLAKVVEFLTTNILIGENYDRLPSEING